MGQSIRVQLQDGQAVVAAGIKRLLESEKKFKVNTKTDCTRPCNRECISPPPDVLIIDLYMRGICGLDCMRRILSGNPAVRILVLSGHENKISVKHALHAGAKGFVSKKSSPKTLFKAIRAVADGKVFVDPCIVPEAESLSACDKNPFHHLTHREFEVLTLMLEGCSADAIADTLFISKQTIANHHTHINKKLGVANMVELTRLAIRHGMIEA